MAAMTQQQPVTTANSQPESPRYVWVSLDDAEKLKKYLFKNYVPKNDAKFAKKFFWQVISIIPYTPYLAGGPEDHLYKFMLQKFQRDKTETVSIADKNGNTQDIERNLKVEKRDGTPETITVDSEDFKANYEPDTADE